MGAKSGSFQRDGLSMMASHAFFYGGCHLFFFLLPLADDLDFITMDTRATRSTVFAAHFAKKDACYSSYYQLRKVVTKNT